MKAFSESVLRIASLSLAMVAMGCCTTTSVLRRGVVVELVHEGGAASEAGLAPGDVVIGWRRENPASASVPAEGSVSSPFDLRLVEVEQAPRGRVALVVLHRGEKCVVGIASTRWGLETRAKLSPDKLNSYLEVERRVEAGDAEGAFEHCRQLAAAVRNGSDPVTTAWMLSHGADLLAKKRQYELVHRLYAEALETVSNEVRFAGERAWLYEGWGEAFRSQGLFAEAEARHLEALRLQQKIMPGSLAVADCYNDLGIAAKRARELDAAEEYFRRSLEIRELDAPGTLNLAATINNLGGVALERGMLDQAEALFTKALAIRSDASPGSLDEAASLSNLSTVAWRRGDLATAQSFGARALALRQAHAPESLDVARSLEHLGNVAIRRGDLATAGKLYEHALALKRNLAPDSLEEAVTQIGLGAVALRRGDLEGAAQAYRRALSLTEVQAPKCLQVAQLLNNLAIVALQKGDPTEAEALERLSVSIKRELVPDSLTLSRGLHELGVIVAERGDVDQAEELFREALAIKSKLAPESPAVATTLRELGVLARDRGASEEAETLLRRALAIRQTLAHGSLSEAESHHDLGLLWQQTGRPEDALTAFEAAVSALESQQGRLGGSQRVRTEFRAARQEYFHDLMDETLQAGRPEQAFHVLERSRAYGLLAMLAERDLVFAVDLPPELESERRATAVTYERLQEELGELSPAADGARIEELGRELSEVRRRREELAEEIRAKAPGLADLEYPRPLDAEQVLATLDTGTVLLAYAVAEDSCYLFVVSTVPGDEPGFAALELEVDGATLEAEVRAFRDYLLAGRRPGAGDVGVRRCGRRLYDWLLLPAERWTATAEHIVICPDGVLHTLPFAATVRLDGDARREPYLVAWKPVHTVVSATVYAQLSKLRPQPRLATSELEVVAVGDPVYSPAPASAASEGTEAKLHDQRPSRSLPASRHEVEGVVEIWEDQATAYLGADATEERVKGLDPAPNILHLACHAVLDGHIPLDSALVLSTPHDPGEAADNGLLQAWEILEQVRMNADLVVLSACDTGLGEHLQGEGLIGLTRAFQYAGARSIVASLWKVSDESTAALMRRFHRELHAGVSKDEALRRAQRSLLQGTPDSDERDLPRHIAHPYSWAGFEVIGDWR